MKILFITPSYKPAFIYGGPIVVVALLAESLAQQGHQVTVYTTTANGDQELPVVPDQKTQIDGVTVYYFKRDTGDHTHVSFSLWRLLGKTIHQFDVVHIHSWWNLLVIGAVWICKRKRIRPVLSPHGMFSSYILNTSNAFTKRCIHVLLGKRLLAYTRLHVSTQMEWEESQQIIPHWQGTIIPNLVVLPLKSYERQIPENESVFRIGFLSRIDPKKGLDILIKALSKVDFSYQLFVAGSGDEEYVSILKNIAKDCGNETKIEWVGWQKGEEKFAFLSQLDLFSLTSHSENFAIVVIESLAVGTPVLISNQVGLYSYIQKNQLGWVTDTDVESVKNELEAAYQHVSERRRIQSISPNTIQHDFNIARLTEKYLTFYTQNAK